jgi:hypothetical protein
MSTSSFQNKQVIMDLVNTRMDDLADLILEKAVQQLIDDGKIDTGAIIKTANVNREYLHKQVVFPMEYSDVVNYGRQPNSRMPPPSALYDWVRRKLGVQGDTQIKQTAYLIARAIGERGIEGTFFAENAILAARDEIGL